MAPTSRSRRAGRGPLELAPENERSRGAGVADAQTLRGHGDGREDDLGRGAVAEFRRPVVLHLPPDLEAGFVAGLGLGEHLGEEARLVGAVPGEGPLDFAEDVEFHGRLHTTIT